MVSADGRAHFPPDLYPHTHAHANNRYAFSHDVAVDHAEADGYILTHAHEDPYP